jgi:hypothetical protein
MSMYREMAMTYCLEQAEAELHLLGQAWRTTRCTATSALGMKKMDRRPAYLATAKSYSERHELVRS